MNINQVWSLYYMLQVLTVVTKLDQLSIPASSQWFLESIDQVANFNILKNPRVKQWFKIHKQVVLEFMLCTLGEQLCLVIGLTLAIACSTLLYKRFKNVDKIKELYQKIRKKLLYNSFLRSTLTTYMGTSFAIFYSF
jgi:hypothetical protein